MKSNNWNCKTKKCLKVEEKPKTQNEKGEREEKRQGREREEPKLEPWCCYIVFNPKAYQSILNPSP